MPTVDEKKVDTSTFWFIIVPITIFLILCFFLYVVFSLNSVQVASSKKIFEIVRKLKHS